MSTQPAPSIQRTYALRYWPTWVALAGMWCMAQLPYRLQMMSGRLLGRALYHLATRRRRIAARNLELCFPHQSAQQRATLLHNHFLSLGMGSLETAMSWWTPESQLRNRVQIQGLEHLRQAHEAGKGVILLSGHFTSLEIGGRLLALYAPFHVLYRTHKNPLFESVMKQAREHHFEKAIAREDMRGMIRSLRENRAVWYAPDQDYGREKSVFAPFFGINAATITATARLARSSGAAVVPFFQQRLPDDQGYALQLYPALTDFPGDDPVRDAQRINEIIEQRILEMPEQYLWVHRRFKTRPEGEGSLY